MDPVHLSVSELCRASVDPAWRQRWIEGDDPRTQVFAPAGSVAVHGTKFHKYAAQLIRRLRQEPALAPDEDGLFLLLLEAGAEELLDSLIEKGEVDSAAHLTKALHCFAGRVAALRAEARSGSWSDVFVEPEYPV